MPVGENVVLRQCTSTGGACRMRSSWYVLKFDCSARPFAKVISGNSDAYVVNVSGTTVAVPNLQLNVGNQIITGPAGSASIFLTDGEDTAELSLAENTSVTISDLLDLLVDETVGRVDHAVDCLRQGSAFRKAANPG